MKLFDLHADIGYDVMKYHKQGNVDNIVDKVHVPKMLKGACYYVCMASYFEGHESWEDMMRMVSELRKQIDECDMTHLVLKPYDFIDDKINVIMSIEGMCGIKDDVEAKIDWLYDHGIRLASLCWNDENALATGVAGDHNRGLTALGYKLIMHMKAKGMILDVSHANEKTFWDMMEIDIPTIATHSNCYDCCEHRRNLKKEQIQALINKGGLIGMNGAPYFVAESSENQDITHLVDHIRYLKTMDPNVDHIAFGFDFMDFYDDQYLYGALSGLSNVCEAQGMIEVMQSSFNNEEIKKIAYQNAITYFNHNMKELT